MSEEKKVFELNDEDLDKVSGGFFGGVHTYENDPGYMFKYGDIVEDDAGVRYQILYFENEEMYNTKTVRWFKAEVIFVPKSAEVFTKASKGDWYSVNSGWVHLV